MTHALSRSFSLLNLTALSPLLLALVAMDHRNRDYKFGMAIECYD